MTNIPQVKPGIIAVSRDCFPVSLSVSRRAAVVSAYGEGIYECPVTVENEKDALAALADESYGDAAGQSDWPRGCCRVFAEGNTRLL